MNPAVSKTRRTLLEVLGLDQQNHLATLKQGYLGCCAPPTHTLCEVQKYSNFNPAHC